MEVGSARLDDREVQQFVDERQHQLAGVMDVADQIELVRGQLPNRAVGEELGQPADGDERVAQVMGGHPEKPVFRGIGPAQLVDELALLFKQHFVLQMNPDARERLLGAKGLGEIVDAAGLQALDDVLRFMLGRDEDNRRTGFTVDLFQAPAGLQAVNSRHQDVQEHQVGMKAAVFLDGRFARVGGGNLNSFRFQYSRKYAQIKSIIIH